MRRVTARMNVDLSFARAWNRRRGWGMVVHCLRAEKGSKHTCVLQGHGLHMEHLYRKVTVCGEIAALVASFL
jgi:hypothetical protein